MAVAVAAGDEAQVTRSYVASRDDDVLYAVDSRQGGEGCKGGERPTAVGHPFSGSGDTRIYVPPTGKWRSSRRPASPALPTKPFR